MAVNTVKKIFITYSHKDEVKKETLIKRLAVMKKQGLVEAWDDTQILAGDKWEHKIEEKLKNTDILLHLTSSDSLSSESCNKELVQALKNEDYIKVIPIILEHCDWEYSEITGIEVLPKKGKPINKWNPRSEGWQNVIDGIRTIINNPPPTNSGDTPSGFGKDTPSDQYFNNGNFLLILGQYQGAIEKYSQAIKINPQYAEACINRGVVKAKLGDLQEAIDDYNQAIVINPQYAKAYNNRGNAKAKLGDLQEAIDDYDQAIEINPQYANAYNNRGIVKAQLGNHQGAIDDFTQAIAINPQYAEAYNNRGIKKADLGDLQGAIADYDKAIAINPQYAEAYNNSGNAKADLGDLQEAIDDYNKAIEINPQLAEARSNIKLVKELLKKEDETNTDK